MYKEKNELNWKHKRNGSTVVRNKSTKIVY